MSSSRNLTTHSGLIPSTSSSEQVLLNEGFAPPTAALLSPISNRLLDAEVSLYGDDVEDMRFLHVVLAQCGLPYREPKTLEPFYEKRNGCISIVLTPGVLLDPVTRRPTMQGIPYGAKPRLLMIHLCTMATETNSLEIDIAASMSAFMRDLGLSVSGGKQGSIARFKDQLNRFAATRMQLLFQDEQRASMVNSSPAISRYDNWFPKDPISGFYGLRPLHSLRSPLRACRKLMRCLSSNLPRSQQLQATASFRNGGGPIPVA